MKKFAEVEDAKRVMNEAMEWSVFTWLFQKRKVREIADRANDVLDRRNAAIKAKWDAKTKAAYRQLTARVRHSGGDGNGSALADAELFDFLVRVKQADDAAHRARYRAEETFDEAERQLNTNLAREGCRQAIHSWELHQKAIRCAEAISNMSKVA